MGAGLPVNVFLLWFSSAINVPGQVLLKNENWDFSLDPTKKDFYFSCLPSFLLNLVGFDIEVTQFGARARKTTSNLY